MIEWVLDFITIVVLIWLEKLLSIVWLWTDSFQGYIVPKYGFLFPLLRRLNGLKLFVVLLIIIKAVFLEITFWILELFLVIKSFRMIGRLLHLVLIVHSAFLPHHHHLRLVVLLPVLASYLPWVSNLPHRVRLGKGLLHRRYPLNGRLWDEMSSLVTLRGKIGDHGLHLRMLVLHHQALRGSNLRNWWANYVHNVILVIAYWPSCTHILVLRCC